MDSMAEINAPWVDPEEPHFPENHPGLADVDYMRRRRMFFYLARDHRLRGLPSPQIAYVPQETHLWREISERLDALHVQTAAAIYREGKRALGLSSERVPQLGELERILLARSGVRLVPAEGLLHGKTYFELWGDRIMPCTQFLRHDDQPEYTPEPDVIHDVIGHVPPLMDPEYASLIELIGQAARRATPDQLEELVRFYWFTIEFGLLEEAGEVRVLGAGILSSIGETEHYLSGDARIVDFALDHVLATAFDTTELQPTLFCAPSLQAIMDAADELFARWN